MKNLINYLLSLTQINSGQKLLLGWFIEEGENTNCTNEAIASKFHKHETNLSKDISTLVSQNLIRVTNRNNSREISLSENVKAFINIKEDNSKKYITSDYKVNNQLNSVITNQPKFYPVTKRKIAGIIRLLYLKFADKDLASVYTAIDKLAYDKLMSYINDSSFGSVIMLILHLAEEKGHLSNDKVLPYTEFKRQLSEYFQDKFKLLLDEVEYDKFDKEPLGNFIDVSQNYDLLLKPSSQYRLMKFKARLMHIRPGGDPAKGIFGNLTLILGSSTKVYMTLSADCYSAIKDRIEGYVGKNVEVHGQVSFNKHYNQNTLRNHKNINPIKLSDINPYSLR
ncbi:hypothetical protein [Mucilaginibacter lacusdianchii]|uniref:hypothetical protein n=1 Tax=Mucilaginibacter lacusdianchii TaxID=2684211 RepID=UPI00131B8CBA|nr:hypothetical protein [Mucilaginibacter sp. JXJ CY 39]